MFETKITFQFFAEYDRSGIIEYLNKMAQKGWILKSKYGIRYKFIKTDKPYIRYDVTFFADADKENNYIPYGADRYFEIRQAAGWQFLTNDRKMMIFISESPDTIPLETDPVSQVEVIHQSMVLSYLPQKSLLVILWLWQKMTSGINKRGDALIVFAWLLVGVEILWYIKWYFKAKKMAVEYGVMYETGTPWPVLYVEPIIFLIMLGSLVVVAGPMGLLIIAFIAFMALKEN